MKDEILQILENSSMGEKETKSIYTELLVLYNVRKRNELLLFADYSESDKVSQATDECVDNYLDQK